jgi:hypothetical protein
MKSPSEFSFHLEMTTHDNMVTITSALGNKRFIRYIIKFVTPYPNTKSEKNKQSTQRKQRIYHHVGTRYWYPTKFKYIYYIQIHYNIAMVGLSYKI